MGIGWRIRVESEVGGGRGQGVGVRGREQVGWDMGVLLHHGDHLPRKEEPLILDEDLHQEQD